MTASIALGLAQEPFHNPVSVLFSGGFLLFMLLVVVIVVIGCWRVNEKAGQPGWAVLVPFYNVYVLLKIVGRPGWWLILYFIPVVNFLVAIIVSIDIARAFGQSAMFGFVLIFLLGGLGFLVLGFGDYSYQGSPN